MILWVPKTRPGPVTCGFTRASVMGLMDLRNCAINPNRPVAWAFAHLSRPPDGSARDRTVSQYARL